MATHPAHRLVQLGVRSLGFDPGPIDGWYGAKTAAACRALINNGPAKSSVWAGTTLQRGLRDLGYYSAAIDGDVDLATKQALRAMVDADGEALASAANRNEVLEPVKPILEVPHSKVLFQGSSRVPITTLMMHCGALPGRWHIGKSNRQMLHLLRQMHTLPTWKGGRGWSDTGYHEVIFPDGEKLKGRPLDRFGAGAIGYNRGVKHVLMIETETITRTAHPEDYFTPETLEEMSRAVEQFAAETRFQRLLGHREVAAKLCPGFEVIDSDWTTRAVA